MERLPTSRGCIVCGKENPIGLHVHFHRTPEGAETSVTPGVNFQGFDGVLQGGIVSGLMDDAMWYSIYGLTGAITMTAELNVRFRAPVPVETELKVIGRLEQQRRSLYSCTASILGPDGKVLAEAAGKFLPAPAPLTEGLSRDMD